MGIQIAVLGDGAPPKRPALTLDLDAGELEAISLAQEIHANSVRMDDRAGRNAAQQHGLAVIGAIGLLEQAAVHGLIDLPTILAKLRQTNARLDPELIQAALPATRHGGRTDNRPFARQRRFTFTTQAATTRALFPQLQPVWTAQKRGARPNVASPKRFESNPYLFRLICACGKRRGPRRPGRPAPWWWARAPPQPAACSLGKPRHLPR